MGYEIKTLEDSLAGHVFEINGAIALKNYTAQVNGDRITITSTNNAALSLLECDVSEVKIDGIIHDNAVDAQNALRSIIYNDLPIVILTAEEKKKLLLKVDENHPDAKKLFSCDGSVFEFTESVLNIKIGGRNYLKNSNRYIEAYEGDISYKKMFLEIVELKSLRNNTITMSYEYEKTADFNEGNGVCGFYAKIIYVDGTKQNISDRFKVTNADKLKGRVSNTITIKDKEILKFEGISNNKYDEFRFGIYCIGGGERGRKGSVKIGRPQLEISNIPSDWRPAIEDVVHKLYTTTSINTGDLLQGLSQNGRHTILRNGANDLNITIDSEVAATYLKTGTGTITFNSTIHLVLVDGTNKLNGKIGSTATVSVDDGKAFLRVSNV